MRTECSKWMVVCRARGKSLILDFIISTFTGDVGASIMVFSWRADAVSLPSFPKMSPLLCLSKETESGSGQADQHAAALSP